MHIVESMSYVLTQIFLRGCPLDVAPEVLALILILGGKSGGAPWWGG